MILVDSSIWIEHLRRSNADLVRLLETGQVMVHPWIIGELALGSMRERERFLRLLQDLPTAEIAHDDEVLAYITRKKLYGCGIGYVDASLLASAEISDVLLWTRDKKLRAVAERLRIAY